MISIYTSILSFFFYCHVNHRDLHSFPTRRSSDLQRHGSLPQNLDDHPFLPLPVPLAIKHPLPRSKVQLSRGDGNDRSEEHTSELHSHVNLVCRLLLEKKNLLYLQNIHLLLHSFILLANT